MTDLEFYQSKVQGKTIGDFIRAVMVIDNPDEARRFYQGTIANIQQQIDSGKWESKVNAVQAANSNIGWCFGEGMQDERVAMWRSVSDASHPVFGSSRPMPEEALRAGLKAGREKR